MELVLKEIADTLARGETVKLSSFGSFMVRKKGQRIGRNPKTGTAVPILPRRVIAFKPSAILKQQINGRRNGTQEIRPLGWVFSARRMRPRPSPLLRMMRRLRLGGRKFAT